MHNMTALNRSKRIMTKQMHMVKPLTSSWLSSYFSKVVVISESNRSKRIMDQTNSIGETSYLLLHTARLLVAAEERQTLTKTIL